LQCEEVRSDLYDEESNVFVGEDGRGDLVVEEEEESQVIVIEKADVYVDTEYLADSVDVLGEENGQVNGEDKHADLVEEEAAPVDLISFSEVPRPDSRNDGVDIIANAVRDCETAFVLYDANYEEEEENSGIEQVLFRDEVVEETIAAVDVIEETIETTGGEGYTVNNTGEGYTAIGEGYTVNTLQYLKKYGLE
jgi:hypothetical protein